MKVRKTARLIAVCLVVLQVLLALGGVSVFAEEETAKPSYNAYRVDPSKMKVDGLAGENEPWEKVAYSSPVKVVSKATEPDETPARFKVLWGSDASGAYLFFWAALNDPDGSYDTNPTEGDVFKFIWDEAGNSTSCSSSGEGPCRRISITPLRDDGKSLKKGDWFEWYVRRSGDGKDVVVEAKYKFSDTKYAVENAVLGLEFITQRVTHDTKKLIATWAWSSGDSQAKPQEAGRLILKKINAVDLGTVVDEDDDAVFYNAGLAVASRTKDANGEVTLPETVSGATVCGWKNRADNKLYAGGSRFKVETAGVKFDAVSPEVSLAVGARVRLADVGALKFEGSVAEFDAMKPYLKKVGILFVETANLTEEVLTKGATPSTLTAANIPFNRAESDAAETFSGVLENLTDGNLVYSALPYVIVEMADGSTVEFAGKYSAADNARSVNAVASAAFNDRTLTKNETHPHKMGKDFGVTGFEALSFSPYNKTELAILKKIFDK